MRPGPARGTTSRLELVVEATMTDEGRATGLPEGLPPTLGTLAMAEAFARMARELLDEHLEDGEIIVPGRLEIIHRTPVPVGSSVLLEATVQMVETTRVSCEILVRTAVGVAARGSYDQEVIARSEWLSRVATADA